MKQLPNGPQNLLNFQRLLQSIRLIANKSSSLQVVGAIDGSHIALNTVPVNEQIEYFNRKQDYSIVIQGVADASLKFLGVSTGYPGSIHNACIPHLSKLQREIDQGTWRNGPSARGLGVSFVCLADEAMLTNTNIN